MNEQNLIGNILCDDAEEESTQKFIKTKRLVLLNREELQELQRSTSAPAGFLTFPQIFWPNYQHEALPPMRPTDWSAAPEFVPGQSSLKGQVMSMAMDQQGSRFLQQTFEAGSAADRLTIYEEVYRAVYALLTEPFGNYVVQRIIQVGSPQQARPIIQKLLGQVLDLSLHPYACRVVQRALEHGSPEERLVMASELRDAVAQCIEDQNGNHVIQKCIEVLPFQYIDFILSALKENTLRWAVHAYGCRVIQKLLEYCPREVVYPILQTLIRNVVSISKDRYGNYVVQYVLLKGKLNDRNQVIANLLGHLCELSKLKFSSNVVEKCLAVATPDQVRCFADELFQPSLVVELATDKFANFVMQRTIERTAGDFRTSLVAVVKARANTLKESHQGRCVLNCIEKCKG